MLVLTGIHSNDPTISTFAFFKEVVGYNLEDFFVRMSPQIKKVVQFKVRLRLTFALVEVGRKPVQKRIAAPSVLDRPPHIEKCLVALALAFVDDGAMMSPRNRNQLCNNLLQNLTVYSLRTDTFCRNLWHF